MGSGVTRDNASAGAVYGALKALLALELKINACFVFALADSPSKGEASSSASLSRARDVLTSYSGKTVEVADLGDNCAKGLMLCDAMSYVQKVYDVTEIIDMATVSAEIEKALGSETAGVFTNNFEFAQEVCQVGHSVFEEFWRMPLKEEHRRAIRGSISDLKLEESKSAPASVCAALLQEFVEEGVKWCHLELAGVAYRKSAKGPLCEGGTGFGVQTLLALLLNRSN